MDKRFWDVHPAWAVTTKDGEILYTNREACIYSDHETAVKEKGSHEVRAVEIFVRKPTKGRVS